MPVMLPRLVIWVCWSRDLSAILSVRGIGNCFCPGAIRRRSKCSREVKERAAKAKSAKSKARIMI